MIIKYKYFLFVMLKRSEILMVIIIELEILTVDKGAIHYKRSLFDLS